MKGRSMKATSVKNLLFLSVLLCAVGAMAENVLYIHPLDPSNQYSQADAFSTKNFAFINEIDNALSIAIWVKDVRQPDRSDEKFIAGVEGCWKLYIPSGSASNKLTFKVGSNVAEASGYVVNDGNWHFLVGTFNYDSGNAANSFQRLYVDGVLVSSLTDNITAFATPDKAFSLGSPATKMNEAWGTANYFGHFAELSVWNRALSASEVSTLYARRVGGNESGLVAYWPLTGTPGTVSDSFSYDNCAQTTGVPALKRSSTGARIDIVADDGFTKQYARFVASPEWCAAHSYVQSANATGRTWDDPLTNLVETAAAAKKFERILCSPGTHKIASSISPLVQNFYMGSCDPNTGKPCPETAIIDAQELCRHFISSSSVTGHQDNFTVENLTFVNGRESDGGSMYLRERSGVIGNCIFHDNAATSGAGGAYYVLRASGTVSNCLFYGNSAYTSGGAVYTQQHQDYPYYQRFVDCVFTNNSINAMSGQHQGGGVCGNLKIVLENCIFADNSASSGGDVYGGHANVGVNSILKGCVFTESCQARYGTCLWIAKNPVAVTNCVFRNLTCQGTSLSFINVSSSGTGSAFVDCVFTNNVNTKPLFDQNSTGLRFRQCLISDNTSDQPVLQNLAGSAVFENCTIPQAIVTPATMDKATTNTFVNCIMPNATITSSGSYCNILSNCLVKTVQNGPYDSGVITGNPKFKDAEHGDYTLEVNSPCRERGLALDWMISGSTDLLGNPRLVDIRGKAFSAAALPDLGCYEVQERKPSGFMLMVR